MKLKSKVGWVVSLGLGLLAVPAAAQIPDTVPYRGALAPAEPQQLPPAPLGVGVQAALDVLYERPSPEGPPPIPVAAPKALYAEGRGPVLQVLPGDLVYAEHVPQMVRTAAPKKGPFSNNVAQLSRGEIRFIGFDRTVNDTKLSQDSLELQATFTDKQGARWRVEMTRMAPLSPDPARTRGTAASRSTPCCTAQPAATLRSSRRCRARSPAGAGATCTRTTSASAPAYSST